MEVKKTMLTLHNLMGSCIAVYETLCVRSQEMDIVMLLFRSSSTSF